MYRIIGDSVLLLFLINDIKVKTICVDVLASHRHKLDGWKTGELKTKTLRILTESTHRGTGRCVHCPCHQWDHIAGTRLGAPDWRGSTYSLFDQVKEH